MPGHPSAAPIARLLPLLLTPLILLVHGYHPFAGDAGLYIAGVRHILSPELYPRNSVFVTAFTHRSVFPWILAGLVRFSPLSLAWILLAAHVFFIWIFLAAIGRLAARLFPHRSASIFATLLAAACCALPVAGTALVLMDPYVTARSLSTPLSLLAVTASLDRKAPLTILLVALTTLVHPLMGAYTAAFVLLQALIVSYRIRSALILCTVAFTLAGVAFTVAYAIPTGPAYRQAVSLAPHFFLFLARWRWYELLGLLLPLVLLVIGLRRTGTHTPIGALCLTSILLGTTAFIIAACFVPPGGPYLLVPFQVLRGFHIIYCVGVVLCGGLLATLARRSRPWSNVFVPTLLVFLFASMFLVERVEWPGGRRLEFPGLAPNNPYVQAFLWIRTQTPRDAVFAFNPRLVYLPGEDEQGFRALSERDQLADDKDAGVAAVLPSLASRWAIQRNAELSLDQLSDTERLVTLTSLGATWLLLPSTAPTALPCPFRNSVLQVCRLRR